MCDMAQPPDPRETRIQPIPPYTLNTFCRLLEPTALPFDIEQMRCLGRSMSKPALRASSWLRPIHTYFGQFIDHDITRDDTKLWEAGDLEPNQTVNRGGGRFDLHHLYGAGPEQAGYLYHDDMASFLLDPIKGSRSFDLPYVNGQILAADDGSKENIILRQICVTWMRLHNRAVQEFFAKGASGADCFRLARQKLIRQYQYLIVNDYLFRILHGTEYDRITKSEQRTIDWKRGFSVPVEFSQAVFRFAHSMIRSEYFLANDVNSVDLGTIFSGALRNTPLEPKYVIDWDLFGGARRFRAMKIDTRISPPLFALPNERLRHGQSSESMDLPPELPVRTLIRGAKTGLPTGEETATAFGLPGLDQQNFEDGSPWAVLLRLGLNGRTPLWYYILLEAELQPDYGGDRLGRLGSRIVAEVIDGCLRADGTSPAELLAEGPPEWQTANGDIARKTQFIELAKFVDSDFDR